MGFSYNVQTFPREMLHALFKEAVWPLPGCCCECALGRAQVCGIVIILCLCVITFAASEGIHTPVNKADCEEGVWERKEGQMQIF